MSEHNSIKNLKTLQHVVSDSFEVVSTNGNINHCSFMSGELGISTFQAVTLDSLEFENIALIHLDVEGFEFKVLRGAQNLIDNCHPFVSFEQHLDLDDYEALALFLYRKNYDVYLINEILPGCRYDCRNFLAIPSELDVSIDDINREIGCSALINVLKSDQIAIPTSKRLFTATICGTYMSGKFYSGVQSVEIDLDLHIFCVFDNRFTKMIAIDSNGNWLNGRYILGRINMMSIQSIRSAYYSSQGIISERNKYNFADLKNIYYSE